MIKWHKVKDKLPPWHKYVLVCDYQSNYKDIYMAELDEYEYDVYTNDEDETIKELRWFASDGSIGDVDIERDYWAYINHPNIEKDGD